MQWAAISEKETRLICVILMHAISALNLGKKMEFLKSDLKLKFVLRFDHLVSVFDETSCFNQSERALFQKFAICKQPNSFSMFPWPDQIAKTKLMTNPCGMFTWILESHPGNPFLRLSYF